MSFSIVMPMDTNRLQQFANTKRVYDAMPEPQEFLIPTRSETHIRAFLKEHKLMKNVKLLPYEFGPGFNPARALNMGTRAAQYNQLIITSPEVRPEPHLLKKLVELKGCNVICHVSDEDVKGNLTPLVMVGYRDDSPAYYFLAMFNKKDVERINGWDEEFMKGYAYEDDDFGARWNRAGLPFLVRDDIRATHQYHPRGATIINGLGINFTTYSNNNDAGVIWCKNGLKKEGKVL